MSHHTGPRHAKPKSRGPRLLTALLVVVAVSAAVALVQRDRWLPQDAARATVVPSAGPTTPVVSPTPTPTVPKPAAPDPGPTAMNAFVGANLPGEGRWTTVVRRNGAPAVEVAWLRLGAAAQDRASIAWIDQKQVRFQLRPGTSEPGIPPWYTSTAWLPPAQRQGLAAVFNGGFRMKDSFGGFYLEGHVVRPLLPRSASAVIYKDGHIDVGAWGTDVRMTTDVVSVRQELYPLLDNGVPGPNLTTKVVLQWGGIVGTAVHTWRSALGVTADGHLLYVTGAALAPDQLVRVMQRAGAVRAMELDINPGWVTFSWFSHPTSPDPTPHKLALFPRPADRYLRGPSARDFFVGYLR